MSTLVERDRRWAVVGDDASYLSPGPSAPGGAGVLAVLSLVSIAVAVWAVGAGSSVAIRAGGKLAERVAGKVGDQLVLFAHYMRWRNGEALPGLGPLRFDATEYHDEVERADRERDWESPDRRTGRLVVTALRAMIG